MKLQESSSPTSATLPEARNTPAFVDRTGGSIDEEGLEYPEGGLEAWLVVVGAWCAMIPAMGLLNTLAVLQAWVSEHELSGLRESTVGWIFSSYAFFLYFCGAQVGQLSCL